MNKKLNNSGLEKRWISAMRRARINAALANNKPSELNAGEVKLLTGLKTYEITALIKVGVFPQPSKLQRTWRWWPAQKIREYLERNQMPTSV